MKNLVKKMSCFLLAFLLFASAIAVNPVSANAALKNIAKTDSWETALAGVPITKDFTLSDSAETFLMVGVSAPCTFSMMIFNSEDMEVDSIRITESDSAWTADNTNGIYVNGYVGQFDSGDYHVAITFDTANMYQFAAIADITEAVISNNVLTITAGFTKKLSVKDNKGSIKWKSSKPSIASVDSNGKVTGIKAGKCTITASVDGKDLKCTVTVKSNTYSATKLTNSEIPYGKASWEAYRASYDENGNLVIKFRIVNNCGHYAEYLKNLSVKVKTAQGSTAATYKESKKDLYVADQSYKDFSITIPKAKLKLKKQIDLRNASIITNGSYGYTYYTYD